MSSKRNFFCRHLHALFLPLWGLNSRHGRTQRWCAWGRSELVPYSYHSMRTMPLYSSSPYCPFLQQKDHFIIFFSSALAVSCLHLCEFGCTRQHCSCQTAPVNQCILRFMEWVVLPHKSEVQMNIMTFTLLLWHALSVVMHCLLPRCRPKLWFLGKPNCVQLLQTWVTPTLNPTEINNNWNKHCYKHLNCTFNSLTFLEKQLKEYFMECSKQLKLYQQKHADNV